LLDRVNTALFNWGRRRDADVHARHWGWSKFRFEIRKIIETRFNAEIDKNRKHISISKKN